MLRAGADVAVPVVPIDRLAPRQVRSGAHRAATKSVRHDRSPAFTERLLRQLPDQHHRAPDQHRPARALRPSLDDHPQPRSRRQATDHPVSRSQVSDPLVASGGAVAARHFGVVERPSPSTLRLRKTQHELRHVRAHPRIKLSCDEHIRTHSHFSLFTISFCLTFTTLRGSPDVRKDRYVTILYSMSVDQLLSVVACTIGLQMYIQESSVQDA